MDTVFQTMNRDMERWRLCCMATNFQNSPRGSKASETWTDSNSICMKTSSYQALLKTSFTSIITKLNGKGNVACYGEKSNYRPNANTQAAVFCATLYSHPPVFCVIYIQKFTCSSVILGIWSLAF